MQAKSLLGFGFSLMEMMIVLLIVAIIAAASAPMVTKKMSRNAGTGDSPWVFTGLQNSIAYLGGDSGQVLIGRTSYPNNSGSSRAVLYIANKDGWQSIGFGDKTSGEASFLTFNLSGSTSRIGMSNAAIPTGSIMFGGGQVLNSDDPSYSIAIGNNVEVGMSYNIAMGYNAKATEMGCVAIGENTTANNTRSIVIGNQAQDNTLSTASGTESIAIGTGVQATEQGSIAIGSGAKATHTNSVAIGTGAETYNNKQIVLGTKDDYVIIPGGLLVMGNVRLAGDYNSNVYVRGPQEHNGETWKHPLVRIQVGTNTLNYGGTNIVYGSLYAKNYTSDRRLKNVGEKYTAGLDELKKLDFFHYTFKEDKDKTPHVGVIAQDLQEVFPDAVTEGEDGYLRIRLEDMFYAVINAVKELDAKITAIIEDITGMKTTIEEQQKVIEELKKQNEEFEKKNTEFEKRLKKLEKRG